MKIIFDSEEEKQEFMDHVCPENIGRKRTTSCIGICCDECYRLTGVEMEVKEVE